LPRFTGALGRFSEARTKKLQFLTLVLGIAVGALAVSCGGGDSTSGSSPNATSAATNAVSSVAASPAVPATAAGGSANVVKMVEGVGDPNTAWKFEPAQITVKAGEMIKFQNTGAEPHSATGDDNSFDSGTVNAGDAKTVTFSKAGTFAFHCSFHPWMKGTITVTSSGTSP
jgi:plastocyanin